VLGAPGVGKSRLVAEFLRAVQGEATVLRGRCLPYGEGITFFPVGEVVKEAAGLDDFDAPEEIERKICAILGDGEQGAACATLAQLFGAADHDSAAEETFWAIRRMLETLARRRLLRASARHKDQCHGEHTHRQPHGSQSSTHGA